MAVNLLVSIWFYLKDNGISKKVTHQNVENNKIH